jgi:hypothetical protein
LINLQRQYTIHSIHYYAMKWKRFQIVHKTSTLNSYCDVVVIDWKMFFLLILFFTHHILRGSIRFNANAKNMQMMLFCLMILFSPLYIFLQYFLQGENLNFQFFFDFMLFLIFVGGGSIFIFIFFNSFNMQNRIFMP